MILIALGANLEGPYGTPEQALPAACTLMEQAGLEIVSKSRLWKTAPVPVSDQPWFHNAVVAVKTALPPEDVLEILQEIENRFGRVRRFKNEARVLDLDIIAYNNTIADDEVLTLPHPRMHERGFVLKPLADFAPDWLHPVYKKTAVQLINELAEEDKAVAV
jgi:2-amino-4-hydroxy-6-hydroxymethyldihydropteridine diphosphokinase